MLDLPALDLRGSFTAPHDSPVLSCTTLADKYLLSASMSGQLTLSDWRGTGLDRRRDHSKYLVKIAVHESGSGTYIATAGWDAKVQLYKFSTTDDKLPAPHATISLSSNPESLVFIQHPETQRPTLIVTRRDSSFLYYYTVDPTAALLGRQNLAPYSNAWVAFTPCDMALCPTDPSLLAIATSSMPHMKLLLTRLLLPPATAPAPAQDQTAQARAEHALQEKEAAAVQVHVSTFAPQTQYSTPALAWRPDGSGVWVNGDDGVLRGFEAATGKLVATLAGGHEAGSKVRCLACGVVDAGGGKGEEEWLVSGGFDRRLIVWRPEAT